MPLPEAVCHFSSATLTAHQMWTQDILVLASFDIWEEAAAAREFSAPIKEEQGLIEHVPFLEAMTLLGILLIPSKFQFSLHSQEMYVTF